MTAQMLLGDLATRGRDSFGNGVAVNQGDRAVSYAELAERVERLAAHLLDSGLGTGDRMSVVAPNCVEVLQTVLAASLIGVTVVPMNLRLRPEDMRFQVDDAGARFAVVHPAVSDLAGAAGILDRPHWHVGDDLPAAADGKRLRAGRPADDAVLVQLYTSGTTGRPKGCLLTQRGWLSATASFGHLLGLGAADVVATPLPLFHVAGLSLALSTLAVGGAITLLEAADPATAWSAVERHGATIVQILCGYGSFLRAAPDGLGTLRGIFGTATWTPELDDLDPALRLWTGYGSTELCGFAVGHDRASLKAHAGAIGRPMASYAAAVVDDAGRPVAAGDAGELLMRGPCVTPGYWNLPAATDTAMRDGWFHTGDVVQVEADGVLRFVDRLKDMVKPGGENVYCVEVESVLASHPAVRECAVIGVPDRRWGEAVKAVVVTTGQVAAADLDAWCLDRLASFKRPRWYSFVDALPRNALEKVLKTDLRDCHDEATSVRLPERS